ncbi:MAG TPA: xanthine dehydrogenase small subunit [Steroidobacteraceae bacterium]|nr:xanthine dehydrogenase small subunit [Steroidobacteraceae bacterium]
MATRSHTKSDGIRFLLDGHLVSTGDEPCTITVLEYLREIAHRTGTKEGCAEGDCGACTVVLGRLSADGNRVDYRAINSCIRFLPTIDGHELVTVESLSSPDGTLHPVQQAFVDEHASQCGFCTPGFVMSLFALYLQRARATREQVIEALSGNLCRCTGYRPIIAAGCRMHGYPAPNHWGRSAPDTDARSAALRALKREQSLRMPGFFAPRTIDELATAFADEPGALLLAGGTDVGLWVTKQLRELPKILYIGEVAELHALRHGPAGLEIGAAVALTDAWDALSEAFPPVAELARRFGSPPVRNSGTLCGNLANGSPIGDATPVLMALGAELELRRGAHVRRVPLDRFYLGYQRNELQSGEFIASVRVPPPRADEWVAAYKLSKRFDQDISAVCAAFAVRVADGRILSARIAFGGMAAVVARAIRTEDALVGAGWSEAAVVQASECLAEDFTPLSDLRGSSAFRLQSARNLLRRFYFEHARSDVATRTVHALAALPPA